MNKTQMIFLRVLFLLAVYTTISQARRISPTYDDDDNEILLDDGLINDEKYFDKWMKKLDETENVIDGILDDIDTVRENEKNNDVEKPKRTISKKVSDAKPRPKMTKEEYQEKLKLVNSIDDFMRVFDIQEDEFAFSKRTVVNQAIATNISCGPQTRQYRIPFAEPNYDIIPSCIDVKRCGGSCCSNLINNNPIRECVASKIETVQARVIKYTLVPKFRFEDLVISYDNATECTCQCKRKQSDCEGLLQLDSTSCDCTCPFTNKTCPVNQQWSFAHCACQCSSTNTNCPPNYQWNSNTCGCEKVLNNPSCPAGTSLNSTVCSCN